jgi:hypothetical protein
MEKRIKKTQTRGIGNNGPYTSTRTSGDTAKGGIIENIVPNIYPQRHFGDDERSTRHKCASGLTETNYIKPIIPLGANHRAEVKMTVILIASVHDGEDKACGGLAAGRSHPYIVLTD